MRISLQRTLLNKNFLRISSLLIGFLLWSIMSTLHHSKITVRVPVCFYNNENVTELWDAPESLIVTLKGNKSDLRAINVAELAVHIDAKKLTNQKNNLNITNQNLFLPEQVKLVNYSPMNFSVEKYKE